MALLHNCLRSFHREMPRCCMVVSLLESVMSQLQQRLFVTSPGYVGASPDRASLTSALLRSNKYALEECLRHSSPGQTRMHGQQGHFKTTDSSMQTMSPFGIFGYVSFSSDSSTSSTGLSEKFKIYTKTGDKGESSLYDGQRRRKDDPTFEALGDVDELNSALGLAHEYCSQAQLASTRQQIEEIQSRLLDVGSAVATPLNSLSSKKVARVKFNVATVEALEKWIDKMDEELPQLTSFILPSGGLPASSLHVARSICRRAERKVVALVVEQVVDWSVAQYLNRLSDYLFTAARYAAMKLEKPETIWRINQR